VTKLSLNEKEKLKKFWIDLRMAVNDKNNICLSSLCHFPFGCSFCVSDTSNKPYLIITKNTFAKYKNNLFYNENFIEVLNKSDILQILYSDIQENGLCVLSFSFPIFKPSSGREGLQGFFSIRKVNGIYKIVSAWSVP